MKKTILTIIAMMLSVACLAQGNDNPKVAGMAKKLDSIKIPVIKFHAAKVADVVNYLEEQAKANDPDKTGVNVVLVAEDIDATVTLSLRDVSLHTVLKLVGEKANLAVDVEEEAVVLRKLKIKQ